MRQGLHFLSGLPRSGSTLLAAILRQNPALHANITSPLGSMVGALLADMSAGNETSVFIDDAQRTAVLRGLFASTTPTGAGRRARLARLPRPKVIRVRVPWIIDSVESLLAATRSTIFDFDKGHGVHARADATPAMARSASR